MATRFTTSLLHVQSWTYPYRFIVWKQHNITYTNSSHERDSDENYFFRYLLIEISLQLRIKVVTTEVSRYSQNVYSFLGLLVQAFSSIRVSSYGQWPYKVYWHCFSPNQGCMCKQRCIGCVLRKCIYTVIKITNNYFHGQRGISQWSANGVPRKDTNRYLHTINITLINISQ